MQPCYLVTGASGHLGGTILKLLRDQGKPVRALVYPSLPTQVLDGVPYFVGDVREKDTLRPLFQGLEGQDIYVIHTAGLIDLGENREELLRQVNVEGTENMLALSRRYRVRRFLYVSSVHAIPPGLPGQVIREVSAFSPETVEGDYAKSKALATQAVVEAWAKGLHTVVVHPSGLLGPGDTGGNHLVRMLDAYLRGSLRFTVRGGYDFVDVRDVALGCIRALEWGPPGSFYLLTGRHYEIRELLAMVRPLRHRPRPLTVPLWLASALAPAAKKVAERQGHSPLFTPYALETLRTNHRFSHDKAARDLGYAPRDLRYTVRDTVLDLLNRP